MSLSEMSFVDYDPSHRENCLRIFDENCPKYFAANERQDYIQFLDSNPESYFVVQVAKDDVAAFGLKFYSNTESESAKLEWILVSTKAKGVGLGHAMMNQVSLLAKARGAATIGIATSHLSAAFFEKFGALKIRETEDGWGEGMHRIDMELKV